MPGKAERDVEIFEPTDPGPEDRIIVERVFVVMPGPGALDFQRNCNGPLSGIWRIEVRVSGSNPNLTLSVGVGLVL